MKKYELTIDDMETAFQLFEFATSRVHSRGEKITFANVYDELWGMLHEDIDELSDLFTAWKNDPINRDGYDETDAQEVDHDCHSSSEDGCQVCDVE